MRKSDVKIDSNPADRMVIDGEDFKNSAITNEVLKLVSEGLAKYCDGGINIDSVAIYVSPKGRERLRQAKLESESK